MNILLYYVPDDTEREFEIIKTKLKKTHFDQLVHNINICIHF